MNSADDQTKYNAQSTNKLQEIWAESQKAKHHQSLLLMA